MIDRQVISRSYFTRDKIAQHHINSFDDFIELGLQKIIDEHTDPWGVKVSTVEIKDVELPESMRRSMAAQAEAERERRAKVIHADGEFQASVKLAQAGAIIAREPTTLQLRYLQTLTEIASEKTNTIVFPLPLEMMTLLNKLATSAKLDAVKP